MNRRHILALPIASLIPVPAEAAVFNADYVAPTPPCPEEFWPSEDLEEPLMAASFEYTQPRSSTTGAPGRTGGRPVTTS